MNEREQRHAAGPMAASDDRGARLETLGACAAGMAGAIERHFALTPPQARDQGHLLGLMLGIFGRRLQVGPSGAPLAMEQHRQGYLEIAALCLALADENRPDRFTRAPVARAPAAEPTDRPPFWWQQW